MNLRRRLLLFSHERTAAVKLYRDRLLECVSA